MRSTSRRRLAVCRVVADGHISSLRCQYCGHQLLDLTTMVDVRAVLACVNPACGITTHDSVGDVCPAGDVVAGMRAALASTASAPNPQAPPAHLAAPLPVQTRPEATSPPTLQELVRLEVSGQLAKLWPQVLRAIELRERFR